MQFKIITVIMQVLLTSQINLFIWYQVFTFYTVKMYKIFKKKMNIFEVSIHFYCIKCKNTWYQMNKLICEVSKH